MFLVFYKALVIICLYVEYYRQRNGIKGIEQQITLNKYEFIFLLSPLMHLKLLIDLYTGKNQQGVTSQVVYALMLGAVFRALSFIQFSEAFDEFLKVGKDICCK